jgi:glycosyltransferase involved in cell wall biosynthesis
MLEAYRKKELTFLIPAFNSSSTINATLLSIILCGPKGSSILVYEDGGSTDTALLRFLEKLKLVTVIRASKNRGPAFAMNYLLRQADTRIVARLDSDDILLPGAISRAMRLVEKGTADIVFSNAILFGQRLGHLPFLPQVPYRIRVQEVGLFLFSHNPFVQSTMVARRLSLLSVGGYKEIIAEDYELWLRSHLRGLRIIRMRRFGVFYRLHNNQLTNTPPYLTLVKNNEVIQLQKLRLASSLGFNNTAGSQHIIEAEVIAHLEQRSFGYRVEKLVSTFFSKSKNFFN